MNPHGCSLFVPERASRLRRRNAALFAGRPPGRVWHGFAVRSAGKDARANPPGHSPRSIGLRGMRRNTAEETAFFTERTLAAYLAVSDRTIRNWIRRGDLPSYKLGASRRIDPADVDAFLAQRREEAS